MSPKDFYRNYVADDELKPINFKLLEQILKFDPARVFEFGMGTGKNLNMFKDLLCNYAKSKIVTCGLDVSLVGVITAKIKHKLDFVIIGDETHLGNIQNFDCIFTCSVLDHIEDINGIIVEFKRIAQKAIVIAETNDIPGNYYYPHNYEEYGFEKFDYEWKSNGDGAVYNIWIFDKEKDKQKRLSQEIMNDDLAG